MLPRLSRLVLVAAASATAGCYPYPPPRRHPVVVVEEPPRVFIVREPPVARIEVITAAPTPSHLWVSGYWRWGRSDFEWIPGHWERPPRYRSAWVPGHWEREPRGWFYVEGFWK